MYNFNYFNEFYNYLFFLGWNKKHFVRTSSKLHIINDHICKSEINSFVQKLHLYLKSSIYAELCTLCQKMSGLKRSDRSNQLDDISLA